MNIGQNAVFHQPVFSGCAQNWLRLEPFSKCKSNISANDLLLGAFLSRCWLSTGTWQGVTCCLPSKCDQISNHVEIRPIVFFSKDLLNDRLGQRCNFAALFMAIATDWIWNQNLTILWVCLTVPSKTTGPFWNRCKKSSLHCRYTWTKLAGFDQPSSSDAILWLYVATAFSQWEPTYKKIQYGQGKCQKETTTTTTKKGYNNGKCYGYQNYSKGKRKNNCNSPVRKGNPFKGTGYKGHQYGKKKKNVNCSDQ